MKKRYRLTLWIDAESDEEAKHMTLSLLQECREWGHNTADYAEPVEEVAKGND